MSGTRSLALLSLILVVPAARPEEKPGPALPRVERVEAQPLLAQAGRLLEALDFVGSPVSPETRAALTRLSPEDDPARVTARVQELLDPYCVAAVVVPAKGKLRVVKAHEPELIEQGWRTFLVKVCNHARVKTALRIDSPNARPVPHAPKEEVSERWLGLSLFNGRPLTPRLGGLELEYRVVQLYSRDAGKRTATLAFTVGRTADSRGEAPFVREWRFDKDTAGWKALNQCTLATEKGVLLVKSTGRDPYLSVPVKGPKGRLVLRFRAAFAKPGVGQFFWQAGDRARFDGKHRANFLIESTRPQEYAIRFNSEGALRAIRLDPGNRPGTTQIEWITLSVENDADTEWARESITFTGKPSTPVTFRVMDEEGKPAMAAFIIKDARGRIYPAQSKRIAPDFFFHQQVYRATGEQVRLPGGTYTVRCWRGPESIPEVKKLEVADEPVTLVYQVKRWIDPAKRGWYSGDHHIHAAGCRHYENPTQGVHPPDMMRHILGEDLKVGCCLTWGPCFDYQKRFFTGKPDPVSRAPYLLRYDVEVSGFGSHRSGHLCLLRLKEQIYPGGDSKDHWPTLGLNTLRWAKRQGAICGPAHSGAGLTRTVGRVAGKDGPGGLPNFNIPAYDGIGANEYIVDITHEVPGPEGKPVPAIDFISTMDTDRRAELNMWYHTLNAGFRVRASGETDFPCISGQRVGMGRVYVKTDKIDYGAWCQGIADGHSYVSDGTAHLLDFAGSPAGEPGKRVEMGVKGSELALAKPGKVEFTVEAAARSEDRDEVDVELVVNGYPAVRKKIRADGKLRKLTFEAEITRSSWVAVRIYPSAHTNPLFVLVDGKPIRASKDSVRWCLRGVDQCWLMKKRTYKPEELEQAEAAYEHARKVYRRLLAESD
jgi:hypothetical protein